MAVKAMGWCSLGATKEGLGFMGLWAWCSKPVAGECVGVFWPHCDSCH